MEVLENTENDLQIDHRTIDCYVITLTSEVQKMRTPFVMNPLNMGMYVIFPWAISQYVKMVFEFVVIHLFNLVLLSKQYKITSDRQIQPIFKNFIPKL